MKKNLVFAFALIGQIGLATSLPLVIFGLLGRYLDRKFGTSPYLFLLGLLIATIQIFFYLRKIVEAVSEDSKNK